MNLHGSTTRRYVSGESGQTHLRTAGSPSDPALVLLHQSPLSSAMYEPALQPLADLGWFVVAPDLPGFGQSDRPSRQWDIPDFARWIWALSDSLSLDTVNILGQHTGATIAAEAYAQQKERVGALVFQGLPLYSDEERAEKKASYAPGYVRNREGAHLMTIRDRIYGLYPNISAEDASRQIQEYLSIGPDYGFAYRAVFDYVLNIEELQEAPLSLLHGEGDLVERMRSHITRAFPNTPYETILNGTDFVSIEFPHEFAAAVDRVLRTTFKRKLAT